MARSALISPVIQPRPPKAKAWSMSQYYNQAEYLEERRAMMQQWADLTDEMAKDDDKVTPIKKAAA